MKKTSYEISEKFYQLFFNGQTILSLREYLDNSMADEMGIIDVNNDTYTNVYHTVGKYFLPNFSDAGHIIYDFIVKNAIHPDDIHKYVAFVDPAKLKERQEKSKMPHFRFEQYRYKLEDGSYRYVEECILSGEENGIPDGQYYIYIFDVQNMKNREAGLCHSTIYEQTKEKIASVTSLLSGNKYIAEAQKYINEHNDLSLIAIDIEHFRLFDECYGREAGNILLEKIAEEIKKLSKQYHGLPGYLGEDDFCLIIQSSMDNVKKIYEGIKQTIISSGYSFGFSPAIGVVELKKGEPFNRALEKATFAVDQAKRDAHKRITVYDESLTGQIEKDFAIIPEFMKALKNGEITFYLQPQCRVSTKKIVGAECLTRWIKKDNSMIPPAEFIPALERYGFVTDLDKYIWEEACKWIRKRLDEGHKPVPISVNISRVDVYNIDIYEAFTSLVEKYQIPTELVKLEITESAFVEDYELVTNEVTKLREYGFSILMDDFGSGYSSLNMLSSLTFDVIKLDALFVKRKDDDAEYRKSINVLESVINMAKQIAMPIIVEGVENKEQIDFLEGLGTRYVQGFYFYRPMPIEQFEKIANDEDNLDFGGYQVKLNEQFRTRELLDQNIYSDSMLNNIIGAVAIYSLKNNSVDIIRFNEQFYETVNIPEFANRLVGIENYMPENGRPDLFEALQEAKDNILQGASKELKFIKPNGALMVYQMHFYYLGDHSGEEHFYGSAKNVTKYVSLEEEMNIISSHSDKSLVFIEPVKDGDHNLHFSVVIHGLAKEMGLNKDEYEEELNNGKYFNTRLDPRETKALWEAIDVAMAKNEKYRVTYHMKRDDGIWVCFAIEGEPVKSTTSANTYMLTLQKIDD